MSAGHNRMEARMPASVVISLSVHAAALILFLGFVHEAPKHAAQVVEGVDLLIAPSRPRPAEGTPKPQLSTMDFLKMALPQAPARSASLAAVDLKVPERKREALAEPKLEDRGRKSAEAKLDALDLSRSRSVKAAALDAEPMSRRQAAATLAAMPKLEDVGRRRVKNLPEALALEDKRLAATSALAGAPLDAPVPTTRRARLAAAAALEEAPDAPAARKPAAGSFLPDAIELKPRGVTGAAAAPKIEALAPETKLQRRAQAAAADEAPKKGVEIEGPLKDRQVVGAVVPQFPDWAKAQRIMEAEVAIRFTVDADGNVMPGMRVERGSGYGRLDRLCMESLKSWTFAKAPGTGAQWGVITFRFLLE